MKNTDPRRRYELYVTYCNSVGVEPQSKDRWMYLSSNKTANRSRG